MDGRFDPSLKSIYVAGVLSGPAGQADVTFALDTGATRTVVRSSVLRSMGYDLVAVAGSTTMTTASGRVRAPLVAIRRLTVLGQHRPLLVVAHEFPEEYRGQGLLGRDFFAGLVLSIDFSHSVVSLRLPGRRWWPFGR